MPVDRLHEQSVKFTGSFRHAGTVGDLTCLSPMADLVNTHVLKAAGYHKDMWGFRVKVIGSVCTFWANNIRIKYL